MCTHETIQLTDEHRIVICGNCGREFGHIASDPAETFVAYLPPEQNIIVVPVSEHDDIGPDTDGVILQVAGRHIFTSTTHPCARCGYHCTCHHDDEECHS